MLGFSSETGVAAGYNRSVTIPVAFATSGSYDCFLPSRQIKVIGERVSMCVDDAGEARLDNSMVRALKYDKACCRHS